MGLLTADTERRHFLNASRCRWRRVDLLAKLTAAGERRNKLVRACGDYGGRISLSVTISAFFRIAFWPAWLSPRMRLSSPDHAPLIARTRVLAICSFCRFSSYNTASGRFYQPGETFMTHLTYSRLCCFFFFFFFFFKY